MLHKLLRSFALVPVLLLATVVAAAADTTGTGNNMTLTVPSSATLIARAAVPVTVSVQCTGSIDTSSFYYLQGPYYNSTIAVTVSQPSGKSVNSATGFSSGPIACNGSTETFPVSIVASVPFHRGAAAITASAQWSESVWGCSYVLGCGYFSVQANATAQGPLSLSG